MSMDRDQESYAFDDAAPLTEADPAEACNRGGVLATTEKGGKSAAVEASPTTMRAEAAREPVEGNSRPAAPSPAETPLQALARLRREAGDEIERLIALLDALEGDPDLEEDDPRGDDVNDIGEPSLAVPETPHWDDQGKTWRTACRSRLRNEDLEFEGDTCAECDREEDDHHGSEGGQPDADGEPSLASLENPAVRTIRPFWREGDDLFRDASGSQLNCCQGGTEDFEGSPTDFVEADDFRYDPPKPGIVDRSLDQVREETQQVLRERERRNDAPQGPPSEVRFLTPGEVAHLLSRR